MMIKIKQPVYSGEKMFAQIVVCVGRGTFVEHSTCRPDGKGKGVQLLFGMVKVYKLIFSQNFGKKCFNLFFHFFHCFDTQKVII